jgi:hypothetical protein
MHFHDQPLPNVLADFARQAGADMGISHLAMPDAMKSRKVSIDLDRADFWKALSAVESATGLHRRPDNDGRMILDLRGGFPIAQDNGFTCGPCYVVPQALTWSLFYANMRNNRVESNMNLSLLVMVEPKLRLAGSFNGNWLRECVDELGHSLMPTNFMPNFPFNMAQPWIPLSTNLRVVPGMGKRIARLKGDLTFDVQSQSIVENIDDLNSMHNLTRTVGPEQITFEQFTRENGQYQLRLSISGVTGPAWNQMQNMASGIKVLDEKDQVLMQNGSNSRMMPGSGQRMTLELTVGFVPMGPVGPPKKLRWEITTQTRQITLPFEVDNLELLHAPDAANN